jgi:hypothetical protein
MITLSRPLRFSSLRSVQNARTRIFAAGSDPIFQRAPARKPAFGTTGAHSRVFNPRLLDRLSSPLTRRHE